MSDKNTAGTNPPSGNTLCPICGAENCPTGFHENVVEKGDAQPAQQN